MVLASLNSPPTISHPDKQESDSLGSTNKARFSATSFDSNRLALVAWSYHIFSRLTRWTLTKLDPHPDRPSKVGTLIWTLTSSQCGLAACMRLMYWQLTMRYFSYHFTQCVILLNNTQTKTHILFKQVRHHLFLVMVRPVSFLSLIRAVTETNKSFNCYWELTSQVKQSHSDPIRHAIILKTFAYLLFLSLSSIDISCK